MIRISFQISQIAFGQVRILRGSSQVAPCIYQGFESYLPKWFSAITCALWLRLIFRGWGSAWFSGAHLLFFHARGRILEAGVGFWNPKVDILARGRFLSDFGVPKKIVLQRKYFLVRIQGDPSCPNELYGPWEPYGQATLPQNPFKKLRSRQIHKNPKNRRWPCPIPVCSLLPLGPLWP